MPLVLCFQLYCFLNEFFWSVPRIFPKKTWPSLGHGQGVLVTYISDIGVDIVVKNLQYMMQYNETIHFLSKLIRVVFSIIFEAYLMIYKL